MLDAFLRTVLESRYGVECWNALSIPRKKSLLKEAVRAILTDPTLWNELTSHVYLTEGTFEDFHSESYLQHVESFFVERVRSNFQLRALRIDPYSWNTESIQAWLNGRRLFVVLTGSETVSITETVRAIDAGYLGIDRLRYRTLGVPLHNWMSEQGRVSGGVLIGEDAKCRYVRFCEPQRPAEVLISGLARKDEVEIHQRVSRQAQTACIHVLNPYSIVAEQADRKHCAHEIWRDKDIPTPDWCFLSAGLSRKTIEARLIVFSNENSKATNSCVYVLPDAATESERVRRFAGIDNDVDAISAYILEAIHPLADALVRKECGNVRFLEDGVPKRAVLRLNIFRNGSGEHFFSGCWQVAGDEDPDVVSPGRGGTFREFGGRHALFVTMDAGYCSPVPLSAWDTPSLCELGERATTALHSSANRTECLSFIGLDLVPSWSPTEKFVHWFVLEANVRPGGLGAAKPIQNKCLHSLSSGQNEIINGVERR